MALRIALALPCYIFWTTPTKPLARSCGALPWTMTVLLILPRSNSPIRKEERLAIDASTAALQSRTGNLMTFVGRSKGPALHRFGVRDFGSNSRNAVTQTTKKPTISTGIQPFKFPSCLAIPEHTIEGTTTNHNVGGWP